MNPSPEYIAQLGTFEGNFQWPYRGFDNDNVTVGKGHLIPTFDHFAVVPWATAGTLAAAWNALHAAPARLTPHEYQDITSLRISDRQIDTLCAADLQVAVALILKNIPWARTLPQPAADALIDMCFDMGIRSLLEYHHMLAALCLGNYKMAAAQSYRLGLNDTPEKPEIRNRWTAEKFLEAEGKG